MKSSQILASVLFGSFAAAAPFKRDLVTKTELVLETVVVYTTVWDDGAPVAEATPTAGGYFYEQPASSVEAKPVTSATPTPAYTPPAVQAPSSVYTPPAQTPSPEPVVASSAAPAPKAETPVAAAPAPSSSAAPAYTPAPAPVVASSEAPAPAPAATSAAAAPAAESNQSSGSTSTSSGEQFSGDITIYDNTGGFGACGKALYDTDMVVALAQPAWGASTYDVMTGEATNPWCGQKIKVEYKGNSIDATIMDMCPGCTGHDIDLSLAAWKALTGMDEKTRIQGTWSKAS